jgi:colanic acid/amylovoran biosynthesis protein
MAKKIVIINQPLSNRGDEAAHRSLMRALDREFPQSKITVLFLNVKKGDIQDFTVESPRIFYRNVVGFNKGAGFLQRWSLKTNMIFLSLLHPTIRKYAQYIKKADIVICAPGGICMGLFQNWPHIFNLSLAKYYNKKLIYYSRSFGTFPGKTKWNRVFRKVSYKLLNSFDFLSIRDKKTMQLADELNLSYVPSIDTAFLDTPEIEIPDEISKIINNEEFTVFVPNSLTWHVAYRNRKQEDIDSFFVEVLKILVSKNNKIIMLPQLSQYVTYSEPDHAYFCKLKNFVKNDNVIVLNDTYSSDIQQKIIEKANCVIGARYHSIVFAINNCTSFISLSYEHKMTGLLDLLNLREWEINISEIGTSDFDEKEALIKFQQLLEKDYYQAEEIKEIANKIAVETFNKCKEKTISEEYGSIIGANAVVTKDLPANCVAAGNPAKVIKIIK